MLVLFGGGVGVSQGRCIRCSCGRGMEKQMPCPLYVTLLHFVQCLAAQPSCNCSLTSCPNLPLLSDHFPAVHASCNG